MSMHRKGVGVLLIWLVMFQAACRGWIEKPVVPDTGIATAQRGALRVTRTDGAVITLTEFFVRNDSIVGFPSTGPRVLTAIARTDVAKTEVRGDTTPRGVRIVGRVYAGVFLGLVAALFAIAVMWIATDSRSHR